MTRTMRTRATAAALLLVALLTFAIPTLWGKPWSIDHFFARVFLDFALDRPLLLSQLRILEPYGLDFHSDDLGDFSVEFEREEIRELEQALEVLRRYERDALDPEQQRSRDVLEWFLEVEVAGAPFRFHDYPVNQMDGIQTGLVDFMINVHQINGPRDAENYRMRLLRFGPAIDQIIEGLEYRRELGVVPPRFVLLRVRDELAELLAEGGRREIEDCAALLGVRDHRAQGLARAARQIEPP